MNKTLVLLILGVIGLAMGLLLLNQYSSTPPAKAPVAAHNATIPKTGSVSPSTTQALSPPQTAQTPETRPPVSSGQSSSLSSSQTQGQAPGQAQGMPPWSAAMPDDTTVPKPPENIPAVSPPQTQTAPKAPVAPKVPVAPKTIRKITVASADNGSVVHIVGTDGMQYKTMHLKNPERVVIDLDGVWAVKAPGIPPNKYVSNVRIGKQRDKTRIVIDLRQTPENVRFVKQGTDTLDVRIR